MEVYIINHAAVDVPENTCLGQMDINLLNNYQQTVMEQKKLLPTPFDLVLSSPLKRCTYIAEEYANNYSIDQRLIAMNFGEWELRNWRDISIDEREAWEKNIEHYTPPFGESFFQVKKRIDAFIEDLKKRKENNVLLITDITPACYLKSKFNGTPITDIIELIQPLKTPYHFTL